jgi:hypothetical protein
MALPIANVLRQLEEFLILNDLKSVQEIAENNTNGTEIKEIADVIVKLLNGNYLQLLETEAKFQDILEKAVKDDNDHIIQKNKGVVEDFMGTYLEDNVDITVDKTIKISYMEQIWKLLCGITSLYAFLQENWTGPALKPKLKADVIGQTIPEISLPKVATKVLIIASICLCSCFI